MKYNHANSQSAAPAKPFNWCPATVSDILSKQEYCGDTVNFHSTTKSFKNKTKIDLPKEDWKVFPDTHPAIISREDYALVQELRSHRRRPAKTGIVSMFSGLLYCADCGHKLYYSATGNYKREQANFFCSTYRKDSEQCSSHFIREKIVSELVLKSMQQTFRFVQMFERWFAQRQMESYGEEQKKELAAKKQDLAKVQKRIDEIDSLFQKLYEGNASGRITGERYETLSASYEKEQSGPKTKVPELENYLTTVSENTASLEQFIAKVRAVTRPTELIHEFIEKIIVSEARYIDNKRYQIVDIYYKGVGMIKGLSPEEMEEAFREGERRRGYEKADAANTASAE